MTECPAMKADMSQEKTFLWTVHTAQSTTCWCGASCETKNIGHDHIIELVVVQDALSLSLSLHFTVMPIKGSSLHCYREGKVHSSRDTRKKKCPSRGRTPNSNSYVVRVITPSEMV
jgi:hypothetical protein